MTDKLPPALRACADALAPRDVDRIIQAVAELPDRTSPDDWPEAMLVTADELREILNTPLRADALAPPEPVDWDASYHQRLDTLSAALAPLTGKGEVMELPDIEVVAAKVHEAWMETKRQQGITSRPAADGTEQMVPYAELPDALQELDRATVRAVYAAIEASAK